MSVENEVPFLLGFMFGESAALAHKGASERLLRWCQAMDDWLAERHQLNRRSTYRNSKNAWRYMLSRCAKTPWEISPDDIRAHIDWLKSRSYAASTINIHLSTLSIFYDWCGQHEIDPDCGEGFNPLVGIPRLPLTSYAKAIVLSRAQVGALLGVLQRDQSNQGRRDFAFFLARLMMGVKLPLLRQLRWGQIEQDECGVWLRWQPGGERTPCPADVWGAISAYLEASGRVESIQPQDYIFAPLNEPLKRAAHGLPQEWNEARCLGVNQIKASLKLYAKMAGLPKDKVTLPALRHTAALLRQEAGDSVDELQVFLGPHTPAYRVQDYLRLLPPIPRDEDYPAGEVPAGDEADEPLPVERPKPRFFVSEDSFVHGFHAQKQPIEEVQAIMAEGIVGMDDEIKGLRILSRALLERRNDEGVTGSEAAELNAAYTQAADRQRVMIKAAELLEQPNEDEVWAEAILSMVDAVAVANGEEPFSEEVRQEALGSKPEMEAGSRRLTEETASTRGVLRRVFSQAWRQKVSGNSYV